MIYLALPLGSTHGWGVCGKYIARELAQLAAPQGGGGGGGGGGVRIITDPLTFEMIGDELEFAALSGLLARPEGLRRLPVEDGLIRLDGPLLTAICDKQMLPKWGGYRGKRTVGYAFFEENVLAPAWIENARRNYDAVITGSTWCTEVLRQHGLGGVQTVIQGVDQRIFFPPAPASTSAAAAAPVHGADPWREYLRERFVVFSGGKFELRKGQDIVIRAFKVLQDRHADVMLINSWYNPWPDSMQTMAASPHIRLAAQSGPYVQVINRVLADNGIDVGRVVTLHPRANALMPRIYHNTDVAIFPNRCEGGTNLVLMEYMACAKPVVATAATGHADVVSAEHALVISARVERTYNGPGGGPVARWPEPDLEEAIAQLEWAYQNREKLRELGVRAGRAMADKTWTKSAEGFMRVLAGTLA